jgi:hypothetical protein
MFLTSASGGLIALGLVATAARVGTAFYAIGLVLLPTLAFIGLVTFERTVQSGLEDYLLARRIALLREYYLDEAPELGRYLVRVPPGEHYFREAPELGQRLESVPPSEARTARSLLTGPRQVFRSVAGMVGVITAVLTGATAGLIATAASNHSLAVALISGILVGLAAIAVLMRSQASAFRRAGTTPLLNELDRDDAH